MNKPLTGIALVVGVVAGVFIYTPTASASIAGFQAGRIMDDSVMADKNSMSVNDIQNFLNSKVPNCDTNGSQNSEMNNSGVPDYNGNGSIQRWEWGKAKYNQIKFPCLKNKTFGGKKAASLIHEAAQSYSINPKVLLVLLQKEQGLITDTWPLNIQYRSATGFGCPDTAACDSQYYGLKNQLDKAAGLFRTVLNGGWSNYPVGNNSIPWNPNIAVCGYSTVNIQNRATSALYRYTPYRPNQAALNAGYGSGNGCSSYGNRNFFLYFTNWFGSTTTPLFTINGGGGTLYLSYGDYYYAIPSMDVYRSWGLGGSNIKSVNSSQLSSYTQGPDLSTVATFGGSSTAYFIDGGKYYAIPSMAMLNHYGYAGGDIDAFSDSDLKNILSSGNSVTAFAHASNGAIYYVNSSKKHLFPDYTTFTTTGPGLTEGGSLSFNSFSDYLLRNISESYPILLEGSVLKAKNKDAIYLYTNSEIRPFSYSTWKAWGKPLDYSGLSTSSVSGLTVSSSSVPALADDGSNKYLIDGGRKIKLSSSVQSEWGLDNTDFSTLTASSLARINNGPNADTVIGNKSGAVYMVKNGEKLAIPSSEDFTGLGYKWSQVLRLGNSSLNLIPTSSTLALKPGSLILQPTRAVSWIDNNFTRHQIPSLEVFNAYGFKWRDVRSFSANSLDDYTNTDLQLLFNRSNGDHFLADRGKSVSISTDAYGASQFDLSGMPQITLGNKLISSLAIGDPLTRFIKGDSAVVYKVENGQKRPIGSPATLFAEGGSWNAVVKVSDGFLDSIPTGSGLY